MKAERKRTKTQDAFVGSQRHALAGVRLQPWTADRMIAFQSLGGLYPNIGQAGWDAVKARNIYPGAVRDVLLALWLCTLNPDEVFDAEARGENAAKRDALAWGRPLGIHDPKADAFWDAYDLFVTMQRETNEAATTPVGGGEVGEEEEDDPGNE